MFSRFISTIALALVVVVATTGYSQTDASPDKALTYPKTRTVDHVDELHGVKVADPYRWLEDMESEETAKWVEAQNKVTFAYLKEIPSRKKINDRITKLWDYEKYGVPLKRVD